MNTFWNNTLILNCSSKLTTTITQNNENYIKKKKKDYSSQFISDSDNTPIYCWKYKTTVDCKHTQN